MIGQKLPIITSIDRSTLIDRDSLSTEESIHGEALESTQMVFILRIQGSRIHFFSKTMDDEASAITGRHIYKLTL